MKKRASRSPFKLSALLSLFARPGRGPRSPTRQASTGAGPTEPHTSRQSRIELSERAPEGLPLLGRLPIQRQYLLLGSAVALFGLGGALLSNYTISRGEQLSGRVEAAIEAQMLSQRLSKEIQMAQTGEAKMAQTLARHRTELAAIINGLANGAPEHNMRPLEPALQEQVVKPISEQWEKVTRGLDVLGRAQGDIARLAANADNLEAGYAGLKETLDVAYLLMIQRGEYQGRASAVQALGSTFASLSKNMALASRAAKLDLSTAATLGSGRQEAVALLDALMRPSDVYSFGPAEDPEVRAALARLEIDSAPYLASVLSAAQAGRALTEGKAAASGALPPLDVVFARSGDLRRLAADEIAALDAPRVGSRVMLFLAGAFMLLLAWAYSRDAARRAWAANMEHRETDQAVIDLITGLGPVSGGDLTTRLQVTEHVTGAIADSINATLEQLQDALEAVKSTSTETGALVHDIQGLSARTRQAVEQASLVARASRATSQKGAGLVGEAVTRMEAVRGKIQDVSKRVKRLGEVSQAIGRVTGIIENVTEKTAILAMNTSLKAEESGEAGKPFRVIADEIRKLSDSTMKSLDEIGEAVKSIQSETQTVIRTVEEMTSDVVEGSKLWDEANAALIQITTASSNIEKLVGTVNEYSSKQVQATSEASSLMAKLLKRAGEFVTRKGAA